MNLENKLRNFEFSKVRVLEKRENRKFRGNFGIVVSLDCIELIECRYERLASLELN